MAVRIPLQGYLVPHAVGRVNFAGRDLTECSNDVGGLYLAIGSVYFVGRDFISWKS